MPRPKKNEPSKDTPPIVVPKGNQPKLLRGFKDILASEQKYWNFLYAQAGQIAESYGFDRIDTPILEETSLFTRSVGRQTDIVSKEMFSFIDTGGENVSLRPEATASIVRAYVEHGMVNQPQPVKLYYWGPMFRRERPQAGRYRQFWQFGIETIGSKSAVVDAQVILAAFKLMQQAGLKDINVQINSIGCNQCRNEYKKELVGFYKNKRRYLCEDCKKRLVKNPLRLLDCKEPGCQNVAAEAPQILDWLDDECKNHFMQVLEYLDGMEIPYVLNPYLVRGLDYYTRTVFEIWPTNKTGENQSALAAGGRYDDLVGMFGGNPTPACGFAAGIERIILQLKENQVIVPEAPRLDVFLAQIGEQAKVKAMKLYESLREKNIAAAENFSKDSLKSQLEFANKVKAKYVLILGQKEVLDGTILIRDMENGVQEVVDFGKIVGEILKKLSKNGNGNGNGNGHGAEAAPTAPGDAPTAAVV